MLYSGGVDVHTLIREFKKQLETATSTLMTVKDSFTKSDEPLSGFTDSHRHRLQPDAPQHFPMVHFGLATPDVIDEPVVELTPQASIETEDFNISADPVMCRNGRVCIYPVIETLSPDTLHHQLLQVFTTAGEPCSASGGAPSASRDG
ncbi:hypothetical protein CYMTET_43637 [Cymbomonas tetramitiformis]|uniref:Uncharacterized protein n=1 Tax=Cymbomonas tetramitiformis TaxID=36881 RepID=A0AAE0C1S1_9CHLO|nr:hypothetical protein CYMTET_43637 [Cymbomonas tetramitiformis]